ncbi:hypothetical protein AGMMS49992_17620 [Clostridia bacterium]|nr:hypothetical protein AGMMS49992_17620 [Clostridia bacterium]
MPTYNITSYTELQTRFANAANGDVFVLVNPIEYNTNTLLTLTANPAKTVTLKSAVGGPYVIKRMPAASGSLITINYGSTLILSSVILDGNRTIISDAVGPLINNLGTFIMNADPDIGVGSTLRNNAITTNNTQFGGGLHNNYTNTQRSTATITDGTITNNYSYRGGGISNSDQCTLNITGGTITDNRAWGYGGGIRNAGTMTFTGGIIENNVAEEDGGGIAQNSQAASSLTIDGASIQYNIASGTSTTVSDRGYGGGIYVIGHSATAPQVYIGWDGAATIISNNVARKNGGGIEIESPYEAYTRLFVGPNVIFSDNSAQAVYQMTNPADIAIYNNQVKATQFSFGMQYGYNNFDISYTSASAEPIQTSTVIFDTANYNYPSQNMPTGSIAANPFNPPSDCGYYDVVWYTDPSLDDQYLYNFSLPVDVPELTLYGKETFVPCYYNVAFTANGGDPPPDAQSVEQDALAEEPETMTRGCDYFDGWYTSSTFEPNTKWEFNIPITENMRLYARWIANSCPQPVTVFFDTQGANEIPEQTILAGQLATKPPDPERGCDQFLGWYLNGNILNPWAFNKPVPMDIQLIARWKHYPCILGGRMPWYERAQVLSAVALSVGMQETALARIMESEAIKIQTAARMTDPDSPTQSAVYANNPALAMVHLVSVNNSANRMMDSIKQLECVITKKHKRVIDFLKYIEFSYCQRDCDCTPN